MRYPTIGFVYRIFFEVVCIFSSLLMGDSISATVCVLSIRSSPSLSFELMISRLLSLVTHQVHSYGTRSSEFFYLPQCRTSIRKFSISFQGPKFFNSLSFEIQNATSTASFCCKLKAFLLSQILIKMFIFISFLFLCFIS